jgi:parallel beta-helix repeat protein
MMAIVKRAVLLTLAGVATALVSAASPLQQAARRAPPALNQPVSIYPTQNIQSVVDAMPEGTAFSIMPGLYRQASIRPKRGDSFAGQPGAILSGARRLTTFSPSGNAWVAIGQTEEGPVNGVCKPGTERCGYPEELFLDGRRLLHVGSIGAVGPESWFFDRELNRVYVGNDPSGRIVELSVTPAAFLPTADGVTVSDLAIEKYASPSQEGAISAGPVSGWNILRNDVRLNHGLGIRVGSGARIVGNKIRENGQLGIGGGGDDVLVDGNEIAFNNTAQFDPRWEAGGAKFTGSLGMQIRNNYVHDNDGPGLWGDIDNRNMLFENNTCEDNEWAGIYYEVSYGATIRGNVVRRNGRGFSDWIWGAGILVSASSDVEVTGNLVEDNFDGIGGVQQARGAGQYGQYELKNFWVHDNVVTMTHGWTGIVQDIGDRSYFTSHGNRFEGNSYYFTPANLVFTWMDGERSDAEWRRYGQDVNGGFNR